MANEQPGASDPYSFEWNLGLLYVLDLLDDSKGVLHVEFQKRGIAGIDDVVVTYRDGSVSGIQSKYVKAGSQRQNLRFSDLIDDSEGSSLIDSLAQGWRQMTARGVSTSCVVATNKLLEGNRSKAVFGATAYRRFPVGVYFAKLGDSLKVEPPPRNVSEIFSGDDDSFDLCAQTKDLLSHCTLEPDEEISFLKSLFIEHYDDYFSEMSARVDRRISELFRCDRGTTMEIHDRLMRAVLGWTSSGFADRCVDIAELEKTLKLGNRHAFPPLMLPSPLFSVRVADVNNIMMAIKSIRCGYVFLSGSPGSGKTTVMSCLAQRSDFVRATYYAYRPREAVGHTLAGGTRELTPSELWTDLFEGLQRHFEGRLVSCGIPLFSRLLDASALKTEVLRMSELLYRESGTPTVLVIDGLDHAARSGANLTFLEDLPYPDGLAEGVVIVLGGQPKEGYMRYPVWLRRKSDRLLQVDIQMPSVDDVMLLVKERTGLGDDGSFAISRCIYEICQGNALSVMYAVRSIEKTANSGEALRLLEESGLSGDLDAYYDKVWGELGRLSGAGVPFLGVKLASILSLTDGRASLDACAKALGMSLADAQAAVARLSLLLQVARNGQLFAFNNDLLLYLRRLVGEEQNQAIAKEAGLAYAESLLLLPADYDGRRWPVDIFLSLGESQRALGTFTAPYVMEAIAVGVSRETLYRQAYITYGVLAEAPSAVACARYLGALKTLRQHDEYVPYYNHVRANLGRFDTEFARFRPLPLVIENISVYSSVFAWAVDDAGGGKALVRGWVGDMTPSQLFRKVHENSRFFDSSEELVELYRQWGRFSARWRVAYKKEGLEFLIGRSEAVTYRQEFNGGVFEYLCEARDADGLAWAAAVYGIERQPLRELAYGAMERGAIRGDDFWSAVVELFAGSCLCGFTESLLSKSIACACNNGDPRGVVAGMPSLDISSIFEDDWWLLAFLDGYFFFERDYSSLRYATMDDAEWDEALNWLRFHRVLGESVANGGIGMDDLEFAQMQTCRLLQNRRRERIDHISSYAFDCWLLFASEASEVLAVLVDPIDLKSICRLDYVADASLLWWRLKHGEKNEVTAALEVEFGANGEKTLTTDDPLGHLNCYRAVMKETRPDLLRQAEDHVKWGVVGVLQNKDYFVSSIRELYEKASGRFPSLWASAGRSLFRANVLADLAGDNRNSWLISEAIYRSAVCDDGFKALHKVRGWVSALSGSRAELYAQVEALIGVAGSADEIAVLAAVCLGLGCYFGYGEMAGVSGAVIQLKERAEALGICAGDYPVAMAEAVRTVEEYQSAKEPTGHRTSTGSYADYCLDLMEMDTNGLICELRCMCATDGYGGKVLCVLNALSEHEGSCLFAEEIGEAVSDWLLDTAEYASFSRGNEVVGKAAQIVGNRHFMTIRLPDRGRDWFCEYYFSNAEGALLSVLGIELQICSEEEARDALLELCEVIPCWLSAAGRIDLPHSEPVDSKEPVPVDFLSYSLGCLLSLIESSAFEVRHSAMQGVRAMLAWCPHAVDALYATWPGLTDVQKEAVFEVIESVDLSEIDDRNRIADLLKQELAVSNRLDRAIRLHCLISLQEGHDPTAILSCEASAAMCEPDDFPMPMNEMPRSAELLVRSLDEPYRSMVFERLLFCTSCCQQVPVFDVDASSLERMVSEYHRTTMEALYEAEQVGFLSGVGFSKKASLLLGSDTPSSFLRPPGYLPVAEVLDDLGNVEDWADPLSGIAFMNVDPGYSVVGYQVLSPGTYGMYQLDVASHFGERAQASLLSVGDMALLRAPLHPMETSSDCLVMVIGVGGACSTWYSTPGVVVSSIFAKSEGLMLDPFDLSFWHGGKKVLRYERMVFRSENYLDHVPYCAVTMVSRWIAEVEWLSGVETAHGSLRFEKSEYRFPYND